MISRRIRVWTRDRRDLRRLAQKFVRIRLVLVPLLVFSVACAYSAKQEKHAEAESSAGGTKVVEEEPTVKEEFAPPAFPGQPLQDRLRGRQTRGAKKTTVEDWQKASMGSDEHLDVKANLGPSGLDWLFIVVGGVLALAIAGAVVWKMKPPWLGWLFKILGRVVPAAPEPPAQ